VTSPLPPVAHHGRDEHHGFDELGPAGVRRHPRLFSLGLGVLLLSLPMGGLPMAELQALNRELGRLCGDPPREALTVCRLHARVMRAL